MTQTAAETRTVPDQGRASDPEASTLDIPFRLSNPWEFSLYGLPLRVSVPFAQGMVRDPAAELALLDDKGRDLGAQWRVLSTWKDGSARFALLDYAEPSLSPRSSVAYRMTRRPTGAAAAKPRLGIEVREDADRLTVDTGRLRWVFSKSRFSFAEEIHFNGREWTGGQESDLCILDGSDQVFAASRGRYSIGLEEPGPHRVVVLLEGDFGNPRGSFMSYRTRMHFTAGGAQVLISHQVRNRHDGREGRDLKRWSLTGSFNLGDRAVRRVLHTSRGLNTVQAVVEIPENVDLVTGAYQTSIRHAASLREDVNNPAEVCYSVARSLDMGRYGACAPLIDITEPGVGGVLIKFAMPEPDREGPMRLASDRDRFEIDFYPDCEVPAPPSAGPNQDWEHTEPMHLGEGMGKTREVLFNFHDDALGAADRVYESNNLAYPGVAGVPKAAYRKMEFADVRDTLPQQLNKYPLLESKIDMLLSAPWAYDWPKATGWRDWGDEIGARGRAPEFGVRQFINNEEDYLYCLMIDAWRTGKPVTNAARQVARHLMDIDFIDHSTDPARDGATCPHSTEHTNGEVYPSHQWCQGLLYYYLATGDEEALRVSRRIGDNLVWWVSGPRSDSLHYSGRESAWPLLGLAALYEVTHEVKYRDAGMRIIDELRKSEAQHGHLAWEYPPGSGIFSPYMSLMVFNGIWDMWRATGDESVLALWKRASGTVVERLADPDNWGYLHFRNWPIKWADLTTLARWHALTGDRKYIDLGRNGLRLILAGCPQPLNQTQGFIAMGYRHFIFFLKLADEHGMIDDDLVTLVW